MAEMRWVILESPYAGDVEANVAYARAAVRDSLMRGEAPIASHLLLFGRDQQAGAPDKISTPIVISYVRD
jgi:hypothetical protein